MRVLFYLPVVTPWWFEGIIVPLLEKLTIAHEVHILAPPLWKGTGLSQHQFDLCAHMPDIAWHIVTDQDHPSMRDNARQRQQIVDFVHALAPDCVFCRAADFETTNQFPGEVRHITEGAARPLVLPDGAVHFTKNPFDHGVLPSLSRPQKTTLNALIDPYWDPLVRSFEAQLPSPDAFRKWADLPSHCPTLFVPLEYEHRENFYTIHRCGSRPNAKYVEELIEEVNGRAFIVLTNHPLNELYVNNNALLQLVERQPQKVRLLPGETPEGIRTTLAMMRAADGVLLGDSKAYTLAGYWGTPIIRKSRFETGAWLGASDNLEHFLAQLGKGNAARPDFESARLWFAFHVANNLVFPKAPDLTGDDLIERVVTPIAPERWEANLRFFAADWQTHESMCA